VRVLDVFDSLVVIALHSLTPFFLPQTHTCTFLQLLDALEIPYEIINIDSFEYAKDQMGNKYRAALCEMTGCPTFPQLFIDGNFIGGAADACIMWKNKELQEKLDDAGIEYADYEGDPFEFLPKWMSQNPLRSK
jgi:glutaredoxin-related protein